MAVRPELARLEAKIRNKLRGGINATTELASMLYTEESMIPVEHIRTSKGLNIIRRSHEGQFPRAETGQGLENIQVGKAVQMRNGPAGAFGLEGQSGTGPQERTIPGSFPGHHVPGGYHMAVLAGAPPTLDIKFSPAKGLRKGPREAFLENVIELRKAFIDATQYDLVDLDLGGFDLSDIPF